MTRMSSPCRSSACLLSYCCALALFCAAGLLFLLCEGQELAAADNGEEWAEGDQWVWVKAEPPMPAHTPTPTHTHTQNTLHTPTHSHPHHTPTHATHTHTPTHTTHNHTHTHKPTHATHNHTHTRTYTWTARGRVWVVRVWADSGFLAPTVLLRHEAAHGAWVSLPTAHCFYTGVVEGEVDSAAAVNVCGGLSGVIRVGGTVYLIEPAKTENDNSDWEGDSDGVSGSEIESDWQWKSDYVDDGVNYGGSNEMDSGSSSGGSGGMQSTNIKNVDSNGESDFQWGESGHGWTDSDPLSEYSEPGTGDSDAGDSEGDSAIFVDGAKLHTFKKMSLPDSLVRGRRTNREEEEEEEEAEEEEEEDLTSSSPHHRRRRRRRVNICDSTGSGYVEYRTASPTPPKRRVRRYLYSRRYSIEVMVVVDSKMSRYHGRHVNQYVLTLMSVVALIFRDATIGHHIGIAVVEVMREDREFFSTKRGHENGSEVPGKSAEEMLKAFCKWQQLGFKRNPNHPRRYDTALLLTRENICRNPWTKSCDTLGLAELGTMCSRHASCAIVQDNGLSAAFTIAHELGHLLNMPHDNDDKCELLHGGWEETEEEASKMNVMSRMLDHNTLPWEWSNCSRHYLTEYLHGGHGSCLEDEPWTNKLIETKTELTLAGELFNASKQCQYVFGLTSRICPYMPTCKRLWCTTSQDEKEGCRTQHMPWADGTNCGHNSWCLRGKCVPKDKNITKKIHGNWGEWLAWSKCSRTCGVGVRSSTRHCNSPPPSHGGQYCTGERVRYESCIMKQCPPDAIDFRTQQCQIYNGKNFGLSDIPSDVVWVPKYAGISKQDSCQLFCQVYNKNRNSYFKLRDKVEDGTPCGPDTYDICVSGRCHMAGCDYVLNSTATSDTCGVCNGDNSTCQVSSGSIDLSYPYGYSDIMVIPEGAAMIEITQRAYHDLPSDDNYLVLVDHESGKHLLNGGSVVTPFPKLVTFAGTLLEYSGSSAATERINSTKPLTKKLLVQILSVGDLNPPYIKYSYTKSSLHSNPSYFWRLDDWTNCSDSCDGEQERRPYCVRADSGTRVGYELCPVYTRPTTHRQSCDHTCPATWHYTDWTKCKVVEERCYREREVVGCVSSLGVRVGQERCDIDQRYTILDCQQEECATWNYAEWSPCSCKEGETIGIQHRPYSCLMRERAVSSWECQHLSKPEHARNCSCWFTGSWSKWCDVGGAASPGEPHGECGAGVRHREVTCGSPDDPEPPEHCNANPRPPEVTPCHVPCTTSTTTTSTTTTTPPSSTPSTTTTNTPTITTTSPTLTLPTYPPDKPSLSDVHPPKSKGGKQHQDHSNTLDHPRTHNNNNNNNNNNNRRRKNDRNKYDSSWHQPHQRGADQHHNQWPETNEIPNALPSGYDISGRSNMDDISDNRLDGGRDNRDRYPGDRREERSRGERRREERRREERRREGRRRGSSTEEESNTVDTGYSPSLTTNWQTGGWSSCSKECGGGEMRRQVVCGGGGRGCPENQRPPEISPCNTHTCTEWSTGDWGRCNTRQGCGRGRQHRLVVCRDPKGPTLDDRLCHTDDRPTNVRRCKIPCIGGRRRGGRQRYKWRVGSWSPCSEVCGPGTQTRSVTCHTVNKAGWQDPQAVPRGCRESRKPRHTRKCSLGLCQDGFFWKVRPWKHCQGECGRRGRQRRGVYCTNVHGQRVARRHCSRDHRPRRKQRCRARPCGFVSCAELQAERQVSLDGEYSLYVGGRNMSVFCRGMNTTRPQEYLSLPAGEEGNFAEIYDKILIQPGTCPHGGERRSECQCVRDDGRHSGYTAFSKIKLNTTTLIVNSYDFTYARVVAGNPVRYGEAGDCYSTAGCPQGAFSINLAGTQLVVAARTSWVVEGNEAARDIKRLDGNQRILGRCGGYCGTCSPDPTVGLKLSLAES